MVGQAPTLSTYLVSATAIPVSSLIIAPGNSAYSLGNNIDAFKAGAGAGPRPPSHSLLSPPSPGLKLISTEDPIERLDHFIGSARKAREEQNLTTANRGYRGALRELLRPHDTGNGMAPLHLQLPGGYELFTEALFESSILSSPEKAPGNLARLTNFLHDPPLGEDTPKTDIAKAKILTAFNLMQHTGSTFERQAYIFKMAMNNLERLMEKIEEEPDSKPRNKAIKAGRFLLDGVNNRQLTPRAKRRALSALEKGSARIDRLHWEDYEATHDKGHVTNYLGEAQTIRELIYQAEAAAAPQKLLFRKALNLTEEARKSIPPKPLTEIKDEEEMEVETRMADLNLYARLFEIELRSKQMVLATGRRDREAQKFCADDINKRLRKVTEEFSVDPKKMSVSKYPSRHSVDERNRLIASFQADVAMLMGRLGLWSDAISNARAALSGPFEDTPAAAKLLESEVFSPFVKGHGIISSVEIKKRAKKGSFRKRFAASLADAHSNGAIDSLLFGAGGAAAGIAATYGVSFLTGTDPDPLIWGTAGAFLTSIGRRFSNAWRSEDVLLSMVTGKFDRTFASSAKDLGKLFAHSAMDAAPWTLPSYLVDGYGEGYDLIHKLVTKSGGAAWDWIVSGAGTVLDSATYVQIWQQAMAGNEHFDLLSTAYTLYTNSSLALAAANLVWRDAHPWTRKWGPLFLPGLMCLLGDKAFPAGISIPEGADAAFYTGLLQEGWNNLSVFLHKAMTVGAGILFGATFLPSGSDEQDEYLKNMVGTFLPAAAVLSADIAFGLAPEKEPYSWRLVRSGILLLEAFLMLNTLGAVKWNNRPRRNFLVNAGSFVVENIRANPMIPLVMLTTNAFTAPLGGYIQRNKEVMHPLLIAMQGVAITACILPITLGVSGVLKRKIPVFERAAEGWRDAMEAEKNPAMRLMMGAYASFMGFWSGFNTPYTLNRILRSGTWDVIPAGLRAWGGGAFAEAYLGSSGWDSMSGQSLMSGTNIASGNIISSKMWPEVSGTRWERGFIVDAMRVAAARLAKIDRKESTGRLTRSQAEYARREVLRATIDFFLKAGRVVDPFHIVRPHASLADRLIPFYAVVMAKNPPTFPQKTNVHFFANLFTMLYSDRSKMMKGKEAETFSDKDVDILLRFTKIVAADPSAYDIVLPLVQTLALARTSRDAHIKHKINEFFEENPHIPIMLGIDLDGRHLKPLDDAYRRVARRKVRWKVRSKNNRISEYINGHKRQEIVEKSLKDLFVVPVAQASMLLDPPPTESTAVVDSIPPFARENGKGPHNRSY